MQILLPKFFNIAFPKRGVQRFTKLTRSCNDYVIIILQISPDWIGGSRSSCCSSLVTAVLADMQEFFQSHLNYSDEVISIFHISLTLTAVSCLSKFGNYNLCWKRFIVFSQSDGTFYKNQCNWFLGYIVLNLFLFFPNSKQT